MNYLTDLFGKELWTKGFGEERVESCPGPSGPTQGPGTGIFQMDQLISDCLGERNVPHSAESVDRSLTSLLGPLCIGSGCVRAGVGLSFPAEVPWNAGEAGAGLCLALP